MFQQIDAQTAAIYSVHCSRPKIIDIVGLKKKHVFVRNSSLTDSKKVRYAASRCIHYKQSATQPCWSRHQEQVPMNLSRAGSGHSFILSYIMTRHT